MAEEIKEAWSEFTKDAEKAKDAILNAIIVDPSPPKSGIWGWWSKISKNTEAEEMNMLYIITAGFLVFILVTFFLYFVFIFHKKVTGEENNGDNVEKKNEGNEGENYKKKE